MILTQHKDEATVQYQQPAASVRSISSLGHGVASAWLAWVRLLPTSSRNTCSQRSGGAGLTRRRPARQDILQEGVENAQAAARKRVARRHEIQGSEQVANRSKMGQMGQMAEMHIKMHFEMQEGAAVNIWAVVRSFSRAISKFRWRTGESTPRCSRKSWGDWGYCGCQAVAWQGPVAAHGRPCCGARETCSELSPRGARQSASGAGNSRGRHFRERGIIGRSATLQPQPHLNSDLRHSSLHLTSRRQDHEGIDSPRSVHGKLPDFLLKLF